MPSSSDRPDYHGEAQAFHLRGVRSQGTVFVGVKSIDGSKAVKSVAQELPADFIGMWPHGRAEIQGHQDAPLPTAQA